MCCSFYKRKKPKIRNCEGSHDRSSMGRSDVSPNPSLHTQADWPVIQVRTYAIKLTSLCDQLMFVMPEAVWKKLKPESRPTRGAGVLILEEKTGHLKSVQFAKTQDSLDEETRDYLILRMAYRAAEFSKRNVKRRTRIYL